MVIIELAKEIGLNPVWVAGTNNGEYSSACPKCGGTKRFRIWPQESATNCQGRYWCRECGISGDSIQFARDFNKLSFEDAAKRVGASIRPTGSFCRTSTTSRKSHIKTMLDSDILQKPSDLWIEQVNVFVENAHKQLFQHDEMIAWLKKRGISIEAIVEFKLGWNPLELKPLKTNWGVPIIDPKKTQMWLPVGLVIPAIDLNGEIIRLKIRRGKSDYVVVSGSMNGFSILGNSKNKILIFVESELDAIALYHLVKDFALVVSVGGNNKNRDNIVDYLAKSKHVLVIHDNDDGGLTLLKKCQLWYPHAIACPTPQGKDIGNAIEIGFDVHDWLLPILKNYQQDKTDAVLEDSINSNSNALGDLERMLETAPLSEELCKVKIVPAVALRKTADEWVLSDRPLIEWWLNLDRSKLPTHSFYPNKKDRPWEKINNPHEYYAEIDAEIQEGSKGLAARGSLQSKIRKIQHYFEDQR